ncbi:hypothetical protein PUNSTDRAFT_122955 [Punctularia strigosozonata HHB-11173 SS5]|uniref:Uncharacterized protein n=1 Tax=Punctularia strigosozonata (strain HHB-11173) TaxID=741275 RepID=R7S155_PUNST|nr:uncharacterized protein PUNSTDRAFT_122955 [Punctularia strigosozonata HHB-11173 SS5]EIN04110.1 hypothetical protein PUNSTDRAFT_122955 [Punctularia strigosozonata HHB-11173 SS5]
MVSATRRTEEGLHDAYITLDLERLGHGFSWHPVLSSLLIDIFCISAISTRFIRLKLSSSYPGCGESSARPPLRPYTSRLCQPTLRSRRFVCPKVWTIWRGI